MFAWGWPVVQAHAQPAVPAFPARPVRVVVPAPPGGGTDILARLVARRLTDAWGQQVIVDNRGGASGMIGSEIVARAAPDGHTLLMSFTSHVTNPSLYPKMAYDTLRDFNGVAMAGVVPSVLVVHPSVPVATVKDFIAYLRERPGKVVYGSAGSGSAGHLSAVLFTSMTGTRMVHVPYKGSGPALPDLIAGQLQLMFGNMASAIPFVKSGKIRAIAVTSGKRSATAPELPTIAESGLAGYDASAWFALFAPSRTAPAVIQKINGEVNAMMRTSDMKERLLAVGADALAFTPAELDSFVRAEIVKWAKVIQESGARPD
jgi:tripartite-type tricarboxylate transporter receptor subunit TctC